MKTCNTCACDRVCDHDRHGWETCGSWIPMWISVEERLPEKGTDILMLFEHNMVVGFWHDCDGKYENPQFWCAYTDNGYYTDCDETPTHWMPLPEPPKEVTP